MDRVRELLQEAQTSASLNWELSGSTVLVHLGDTGRHQRVAISRKGSNYVFRSLVLSHKEVTRRQRRWRELARQTWQRNAEKQLVCFTFDERDNLIGQILQPTGTLDREELVLYVNTLARECDEYEYHLSGGDQY